MTTNDKPREVPCFNPACVRNSDANGVRVKHDGTYFIHSMGRRRGDCPMSGKPVPAEMIARADARDAASAERMRHDGLKRAVAETEWDYTLAVKAQTEAIAAVTRANTVRDAAWQRLTDARKALAEADAQRATSITATPDDGGATA